MTYELRADDDTDEPVIVWRGADRPRQSQIDMAAMSATKRGWNGTFFDLYRDGEWLQFAHPSPEALAS